MSFFLELKRRNVIRIAAAYSIVAWLVAQVAELAFDSFGTPDWAIKTTLFVLVMGLPFAIIFAWAFELTPQGLKREKDVDRSQSITQETGRKLNYTIIGILAVALMLSVATRDWSSGTDDTAPDQPVTSRGKSIAVLPFVNMSDDPANEYFSDGISEELLNVLVKVEGLRVASRTSSFSFKGKDIPIPEIADALKVDHVLEGSVRKAGDTVRVTAQLIDVKTDRHLWSETYDRKLEDIFVIQDEISAHIVEALKIALGSSEVAAKSDSPTANLGAYEDYLKGRYFWQRRGDDNIRKAIELFEKATAADPTFARAWSSLGAAHLTMPGYSGEPRALHFPLARRYAERALALDPTLADAYAVLGDLGGQEKNWLQAEEYFLTAISYEPKNPTGYLWFAELLMKTGRIDTALQNVLLALQLDPLNPGTNAVAADIFESHNDIVNQEKYLESALQLGHRGSLFGLMEFHATKGRFNQARETIERNRHELTEDIYDDAMAFIQTYEQGPLQRLAEIRDFFDTTPVERRGFILVEYTRVDDVDGAYALLDEHYVTEIPWYSVWGGEMSAFRRDPRFAELIGAAGLLPYWDKYGWPPVCQKTDGQITCH